MEPWQKWTVVGVAGAGAYWYYSRHSKPKRPFGRSASVSAQGQGYTTPLRDDSKGGRRRKNTPGSLAQANSDAAEASSASLTTNGKEKTKKRKSEQKQVSQTPKGSSLEVAGNTSSAMEGADDDDDEDKTDIKAFAKHLSDLKTGTALKPPAGSGESKRTKKQGKAEDVALAPSSSGVGATASGLGSQNISTNSSTTGADADDDLSPSTSPAFGATRSHVGPGDVSDMLEAPASGPSVLRLTAPTQPQRVSQPRPPKPVEFPETKKQRQHKKKNEEQKAAREQAEKERRVLLEKQLRTAREAEGRPAKNGLGLSKPPSNSAWSEPATEKIAASESPAITNGTPLLDTFDETSKQSTRDAGGASAKASWAEDLPSEEEQLRILNEMNGNSEWNTVGKGRKKKARAPATNGDVPGSESSDAGSALSYNPNGSAAKYNPNLPYALTGHPNDSDWAVV
ncbi:MAG: hypothetical protein LQ347_001870 [Umbilicaria vellea]|nr:MAG: hypothetical protein LQ347_001870 [Umbilicaria vellea]